MKWRHKRVYEEGDVSDDTDGPPISSFPGRWLVPPLPIAPLNVGMGFQMLSLLLFCERWAGTVVFHCHQDERKVFGFSMAHVTLGV